MASDRVVKDETTNDEKTVAVTRVGFIGVGLMGSPMARRLIMHGIKLRVWNRSPKKLEELLAAGAHRADSAADAANGADAVFLCLSDAAAVESVLFGPGGLASATIAPSLLVDFSTIGPIATLALAERLRAQCGTEWVDAPVSGGTVGAEQGRLVMFCGGAARSIARLSTAFGALAQRHTHIGPLGAGQTLKLCNQLIVSTNLAAIAEALTLARAAGLDASIVPSALAGGFADSIPLQIFGPRMAARVTTPVLGELSLMLKDLNAVCDLARSHHERLPVSAAALEVYRFVGERGLLHRDLATLIELYSPAPPAC
jgi:3-hydroxyisobutyrate dehydrogenase